MQASAHQVGAAAGAALNRLFAVEQLPDAEQRPLTHVREGRQDEEDDAHGRGRVAKARSPVAHHRNDETYAQRSNEKVAAAAAEKYPAQIDRREQAAQICPATLSGKGRERHGDGKHGGQGKEAPHVMVERGYRILLHVEQKASERTRGAIDERDPQPCALVLCAADEIHQQSEHGDDAEQLLHADRNVGTSNQLERERGDEDLRQHRLAIVGTPHERPVEHGHENQPVVQRVPAQQAARHQQVPRDCVERAQEADSEQADHWLPEAPDCCSKRQRRQDGERVLEADGQAGRPRQHGEP